MQSTEPKDICSTTEGGRVALGDLKSSSLNKLSSSSSNNRKSILDTSISSLQKLNIQRNSISNDDRRLQKTLSEKDRQISLLQQQVLLANARAEELQKEGERIKYQEREVKRLLSSKETSSKRQTIALKQAQERLSSIKSRDERKQKRSLMERKELEKMFEDLEIEYEEYIELVQNDKEKEKLEMEIVLKKHQDDIQSIRDEQSEEFNHLQKELNDSKVTIEDLSIKITSLTENIRLLSEENDEFRLTLEQQYTLVGEYQRTIQEKDTFISTQVKNITERDHAIIGLDKTITEITLSFESKIKAFLLESDIKSKGFEEMITTHVEEKGILKTRLDETMDHVKELEEKVHMNQLIMENMKHDISQYQLQDDENQKLILSMQDSYTSLDQRYQSLVVEKNKWVQTTDELKVISDFMKTEKVELENKLLLNITQLQEQCTLLSNELESTKFTVCDLTSQLTLSKDQIQIMEESKQKLTNEHDELELELQKLLEDLKKQRMDFTEKLVKINEELVIQQNEEKIKQIREFENQIHAKESIIDEVRKMYDEECINTTKLVERLSEVEESYQEALDEISSLSKTVDDMKAHYDSVTQANDGVITNLHTTIMELRSHQAETMEIITLGKTKIFQLEKEIELLRGQITILETNAIQDEEVAIKRFDQTKKELEEVILMKEDKIITLDEENSKLNQEITEIKEIIDNMNHESLKTIDTLKCQLELVTNTKDSMECERINERMKLLEEIENEKTMILSLESEKLSLLSQLFSLQGHLSEIKQLKDTMELTFTETIKSLEINLFDAKKKMELLQETIDLLRKDIVDVTTQAKERENIATKSHQDLQSLYESSASTKDKILSDLKIENINLMQELNEMKSKNTSLESIITTMRSNMIELKQKMKMEEEKTNKMIEDLTKLHETCEQAKDSMITTLRKQNDDSTDMISSLRAKLSEQDIIHSHTIDSFKTRYESAQLAKDTTIKELREQQVEMLQALATVKAKALAHEDVTNQAMEILRTEHESIVKSKDTMIHELREQYDTLIRDAVTKVEEDYSSNVHVITLEKDLKESRTHIDNLNKALAVKFEATHEGHTRAELNATREELMRVKDEYERLSGEHSYLLGHHNNRQKIHYVWTLKKQISDLLEENNHLRSRLISFVIPSKQYV